MAKPTISEKVRAFLVVQFAMGLTPTQAANAANERFGLSITKQKAYHYDPKGVDGRRMARKWIKLYEETRERFLADVADIPIANRSVRLKQLQVHYNTMVERGATGMATKILEQAAKEAGGVHTNEATVHHKHSGKLQIEEVSEDEMRNRLTAAIATLIEGNQPQEQQAEPTRH